SESIIVFLTPFQASKFLPSKSTMASEVGAVPSPGVMTGGSGQTKGGMKRSPKAAGASTSSTAPAATRTRRLAGAVIAGSSRERDVGVWYEHPRRAGLRKRPEEIVSQ